MNQEPNNNQEVAIKTMELPPFFAKSISYQEYREQTKQDLSVYENGSTPARRADYMGHVKLNEARVTRIEKTFQVSDDILDELSRLNKQQHWLVITEDWCGDSAQNLPYIVKIAESSPLISLRILLRDDNLETMDLYQTNGTRSIPKLVAFDNNGNELFTWGPRPKEGAELVATLKSQGIDKDTFLAELQKWYSQNKGQAVSSEIMTLLRTTN